MEQAEAGIEELAQHVDSLVVIPNERLKYFSEEKITLANAFDAADDVLRQGVKSISELIKVPGFINLDFADVSAIMRDAGHAHMGVGRASGKDKAEAAAKAAVSSPLLETSIEGAHGVIISITSSPDIGLDEVEQASSLISEAAAPDANIIWGVAFDDTLQDEMVITVIATGFGDDDEEQETQDDNDDLDIDLPSFDLDVPTRNTNAAPSNAPKAKIDDNIFTYADEDNGKKSKKKKGNSSSGRFGFDSDDDDYFDSIDDIFSNRK